MSSNKIAYSALSDHDGLNLRVTDGVTPGATLVDYPRSSFGADPKRLQVIDGDLWMSANDGLFYEQLWRVEPQSGEATRLTTLSFNTPSFAGVNPRNFLQVGGDVYFAGNATHNNVELWKTNGAAAGSAIVADVSSAAGGSQPSYLTNVNGTVFFTANWPAGVELWKSNGASAGTSPVADILPGPASSNPRELVNLNGTLYFFAAQAAGNDELWRSGGTQATTSVVKEIQAGTAGASPQFLTNVDGALYFSANDGLSGQELWKTDGTADGTVLVADIRSGAGGSAPQQLYNAGGVLYFTANDGVSGVELWKSDGTPQGTVRVADAAPGAASSNPAELTLVGGEIYFTATDGVHGQELWRTLSSGSSAALVADLGPGDSNPRELTEVAGRLYFAATTSQHGESLWESDGTLPGTTRVEGTLANPGLAELTNAGGLLYFVSNTLSDGRELWKATPRAVAPRVAAVTLAGSANVHAHYAVPSGSGEQLRTIPVGAVDEIRISFDRAASVAQPNLSVVGTRGGTYAFASFAFDPIAATATWRLGTPVQADRLTLTLTDAVLGASGLALDGEWINPASLSAGSGSAFPSGGGAAGGAFAFRVNVLPGDGNLDNRVTGADFTIWADNFGRVGPTFAQGDYSGNGTVSGADFTLWADHFGLDFRAGEPEGLAADDVEAWWAGVDEVFGAAERALSPAPTQPIAAPREKPAAFVGPGAAGRESSSWLEAPTRARRARSRSEALKDADDGFGAAELTLL